MMASPETASDMSPVEIPVKKEKTGTRLQSALKMGGLVAALIGIGVLFKYTSLGEVLRIETLRAFVEGFGWVAPLVFVAAYSSSMTLLLPALPFAFLGALLFGVWLGTAVNLASAVLGATLSFLVARKLGRDFVLRFFPAKLLDKIDASLDKHAFTAVFLLRVLPIFPFAAVSFALGLTNLKLRNYILPTFLGALPWTFAYTYLFAKLGEKALSQGVGLKDFLAPDIAIPFLLVLAMSVASVFLKKRFFNTPEC